MHRQKIKDKITKFRSLQILTGATHGSPDLVNFDLGCQKKNSYHSQTRKGINGSLSISSEMDSFERDLTRKTLRFHREQEPVFQI